MTTSLKLRCRITLQWLFLGMIIYTPLAIGEDIDIFFPDNNLSCSATSDTNIIFVIEDGRNLLEPIADGPIIHTDGGGPPVTNNTYLEEMKYQLKKVINYPDYSGYKFGLIGSLRDQLALDPNGLTPAQKDLNDQYNFVIYPDKLDAQPDTSSQTILPAYAREGDPTGYTTHKEMLIDVIDRLTPVPSANPSGNVPNDIKQSRLARSYYEAVKVLKGGRSIFRPRWNKNRTITWNGSLISDNSNNHIIILTNLFPSPITNREQSALKTLANISAEDNCRSLEGNLPGINFNNVKCVADIAETLWQNDNNPNTTAIERVRTHVVNVKGSTYRTWAKMIASYGHGQYQVQNIGLNLEQILANTDKSFINFGITFSPPGFAIDPFTGLTHSNQLYYSIFTPSKHETFWAGNLKRLKITPNGGIVDSKNNDGFDQSNGTIRAGATTWWSSVVDGNDPYKGGIGEHIAAEQADRSIYTNISGPGSLDKFKVSEDVVRTAYQTAVTLDGIVASNETAYVKDVMNWVNKDTKLGDPLHSQPVVVNTGGNQDNPKNLVFYGDNIGVFHAVDANDGSEKFAFLPKELFQTNYLAYKNNYGHIPHTYGMDGPITYWRKPDGTLLVYTTMRRGGRNIYALDLTDMADPKLKWQIIGGSTPKFENLGQTWSRPIKTKILKGSTSIDVLIFAGGYDDATYDNDNEQNNNASMGNAIYIVNALTGKKLWSIGKTGANYDAHDEDMKYSIPADIRAIDINQDGYVDQFYVGDLGGQIWRFTVSNGKENWSDLLSGDMIADLSDGQVEDRRRFYNPIDLSLVKSGFSTQLALAVGSGHYAAPFYKTAKNRFYLLTIDLYDHDTRGGAIKERNLTEIEIEDTEEGGENPDDTDNGEIGLNESHWRLLNVGSGWYIKLNDEGEKVTASSLTFNGNLFFTTFTPGDHCSIESNKTRLYGAPIEDFSELETPILNIPGGDPITTRKYVLKNKSYPPTPILLKQLDTSLDIPKSTHTLGIGTEFFQMESPSMTRKTYWYIDPTQ